MTSLYLFQINFLFGAAISFLVGAIVFLKNRTSSVNRSFFLLSFFGAIWSGGFFFLLNSSTYREAYLWRLFMDIGSILIPAFWVHFAQSISEDINKKILAWFYIIAVGIVFFNISEYFYPGIFIKTLGPKLIFDYYPTAGFGYYLLILFYALTIPYSLVFLSRKIKKSDGLKRLQLKVIFVAALAGFAGGSMAFLPTFGVSILPIGVVFFSIYPVIIAFSILRHKLFDIKVVATEALVLVLCIFLLIRTILAENMQDRIIDGSLFALVVFFGALLIRSVLQEVRQREEIQVLAEDLRKANLELKKLDQLKSEFVSLASHQLRTPLTVIKGYISMIQEGSFGAISDQLKDALRKIMVSNQTLINLVGDFLNLSRIESGRMKYLFEPMNAEDMMQSVYEEFKEVVKEKKLELTFEKPESPLPQAMLDKDKFRQVIMNLVDNAIKYTPKGWIKMKIEEDRDRPGGPFVLMSISDSGIGMTEDVMNSIFKRFSRGEEGWKANTGGLGLGLYLAKRIVTDHGGEIWATSEGANKGSAFWVRLPARAAQIEKDKQLKDFVAKI